MKFKPKNPNNILGNEGGEPDIINATQINPQKLEYDAEREKKISQIMKKFLVSRRGAEEILEKELDKDPNHGGSEFI